MEQWNERSGHCGLSVAAVVGGRGQRVLSPSVRSRRRTTILREGHEGNPAARMCGCLAIVSLLAFAVVPGIFP